ncbi:CHC2 zinc finger domain-containing protein [Brevibacillus sp. NPDC003359]|uniref:CHC2 zinc finger domain-containing protein n=1 Tax=unclassified Brevibacillus TaxID=2684853 RepID=UPI0036A58070
MSKQYELSAEDVKNSVDISDIISQYVTLGKQGRNFVGLCPFHSERTPSFSVNVEKQFCHCFGCGKGGDVYSFLMEINGWSFAEAIQYLKEILGGVIEPVSNKIEVKKSQKLPAAVLDQISRQLQRIWVLSSEHKQYLQSPTRGMSDFELQVRGYRSYPEKPWVGLSKLMRDDLEGYPGAYLHRWQNGNMAKEYWTLTSFPSGGILIPIHNQYNYIIGWQIRLDKVPNVSSYKTEFKNRFRAQLTHKEKELLVTWDGEVIARFPESQFLQVDGELDPSAKKIITVSKGNKKIELGEVGLKKGQKYFWLSSDQKARGTAAGNPLPVHVSVPCCLRQQMTPGQLIKAKKCWLTEGPIKADKGSEILNEVFVGIPGLSAWRQMLQVLSDMGVEHVVLAFDMDIARKEELREQIKLFKEELFKAEHIKRCDIALWSETLHGKGIDDILLNQYFPEVKNIFTK